MSVRFTVVIAEISKFCILSVCDFKLSYPACNEYGPYWHSLCARYIDFTKLSHRGIIFEIKLLTEICVLILSENFVQIISHCKKKERSTIKIYVCLLLIDCSVTVTIVKFECITNCQKYSNNKLYENRISENRFVPFVPSHTDMTNVINISRNFTNAPNNSQNPTIIHILSCCNSHVCAADSSLLR